MSRRRHGGCSKRQLSRNVTARVTVGHQLAAARVRLRGAEELGDEVGALGVGRQPSSPSKTNAPPACWTSWARGVGRRLPLHIEYHRHGDGPGGPDLFPDHRRTCRRTWSGWRSPATDPGAGGAGRATPPTPRRIVWVADPGLPRRRTCRYLQRGGRHYMLDEKRCHACRLQRHPMPRGPGHAEEEVGIGRRSSPCAAGHDSRGEGLTTTPSSPPEQVPDRSGVAAAPR